MKDYFLYSDVSGDPPQNREIELEVRDQATMEKVRVKAIVSRFHAELPGADNLWLRDERAYRDTRSDNPWAIQVLQEIEEEVDEVKVRPRAPVPPSRKKGGLLKSLIQERTRGEGKDEGE